jgi:hypothetical protein
MTPIRIHPTNVDLYLAKTISADTGPQTEQVAEFVTWGADEHILSALAAGWWLYSRSKNTNARRTGNHILLITLASSALPHLLKTVFNQERPDRRTIGSSAWGPVFRQSA